MYQALASLLTVFSSVVVLTTGIGLQSSLLSLNMSSLGYPEQLIGMVMSCHYLGTVAGIFLCQRVVQRVGHIRAFTTYAATMTAIALAQGLYIAPWFWGLSRIGSGICATGLFMVMESWINEKVDTAMRGRIFSIYMILVYIGLSSSQFLLNLSDIHGPVLFMLVGILFALCLLPIALSGSMKPQPLKAPAYNLVRLFNLAPFSMVAVFVGGMINSSFYSLGPMVAQRLGLEISQVAWFMSLTIWAGLLSQWPVGSLSDRFDRLKVLTVLSLLVAVISLGIAMVCWLQPNYLMLASFCFGVAFTVYPLATARAQDHISRDKMVPLSAALLLFHGLGASLGPICASTVISHIGPWGLYIFTGCCGGLLCLAALFYTRRHPVKAKRQTLYLPPPTAVPVLNPKRGQKLDPAADTHRESAYQSV